MNRIRKALLTFWIEAGGFLVGLIIGSALTWGVTAFLMHRMERASGLMERTDTIISHDTINVMRPVHISDTIVRHIIARLPMAAPTDTATESDPPPDTAAVVVPITQRTYTDTTNYTAWVSGYQPSLDSIRIYTRTQTITERVTAKPRRFSVGLQGGVGITPKGVQPYIGVGVAYTILPF